MQNTMKRLLGIILAATLLTPLSAYAKAIFIITPSTTNITVPSGGTASVSYTVVNNALRPVNQIVLNQAYETNGNPAGILLQSDTCTGAQLAPNASCSFSVLISGKNQPTSFQLRPRVCGYNGTVCSVPLGANKVTVVVPPTPQAAGITVSSVNPSNTSVAVTTSQIVINFSAAMDAATINNSNVSVALDGSSTNLISSCNPSADNTSFACLFSSALNNNSKYNVIVKTGVKSAAGSSLSQNYTTNFLTAALIAGDGSTHTYYVNRSNAVSVSTSAGNFTPITFSSGSPTGTIILLAGNGNGNMFFATSTNEIWQNSAGGAFSLSTTGAFTGNIIQLGGSGSTGYMYFATSTGQVWGDTNGNAFTQAGFTGGAVTGTISQITGDGVSVACFMTTSNQVWCGFFNAFNLVTYTGGNVTGNVIRLTGIVNSSSPINVSFYTSTNQLWQQTTPGSNIFSLITNFSGTPPTGIIQQMASNGSGAIQFVTTTNQAWGNGGTTTYSQITLASPIQGQASAMAGNGGFIYFATSTNQLYQQSTGSYNPLSVGFNGAVSQFSGSGGYMYFVTLNDEIWANNLGGTFASLTHP